MVKLQKGQNCQLNKLKYYFKFIFFFFLGQTAKRKQIRFKRKFKKFIRSIEKNRRKFYSLG